MNLSSGRLSIAPGTGVVARHGSNVVLVHPQSDEHNGFVDRLLELCADEAHESTVVVRRVGALVTQTPADSVAPFGLLVQFGDAIVAVIAGDVSLTSTSGAYNEVLDGREAITYVERRLRGDVETLWLAAGGAPEVDPRSSLTSGVVRGSGVLLVASMAEETAIDLPHVPAGSAASTSPSVDLDQPLDAEPRAHEQEPLTYEPISLFDAPEPTNVTPPAENDGEDGISPPDPLLVEGIYCARSHFNSSQSIFCTQCGISMVQQTHNLVFGPRPPLGVLVTDQGAVFSLVQDYVVGREPETAPEVLNGTALALPLEDPELALSRIHARVLLDGWEVRVEDAHSANGTFVSKGGQEWTRLEPGLPTTIPAGTQIALGGRTVSFETHQRS